MTRDIVVPNSSSSAVSSSPPIPTTDAAVAYASASDAAAEYMRNFENIIAPGREPVMTKEYKPQVAHQFERYLNPQKLKQHVLHSDKMAAILEYYAKETDQPLRQLKQQARKILDEIGLDRNLAIIRWCGMAITAIGKRICDGIYVNAESIAAVKEDIGRRSCPVLYLPSHRSYMDFVLMSYICFYYDVEIPGIAAGMDFHSMYGMGTMLRKTGAFFMRRSFSNDELYWDIFRQYMYALVASYHIGVEFFIEGTRSRNFKALVPKVGLLSMALLPYFTGEVSDVTIVPVSVSYERVLEEQLFVYELLGVPKPKESTKGFFKALKIVDERFGKMYLDFGAPISAREFFGHSSVQRIQRAGIGAHLQKLNRDEIEQVKQLANEVIYQQQRRIVINTFNLLSLYYASQLYAQRSVNIDELSLGILHLKHIFEQLGAHVSTSANSIKADIIDAVEIHSNIVNFRQARLEFTQLTAEQLEQQIDMTRLKGHALCSHTMAVAVPMLALQLYINPSLFWLARLAYLVLGALKEQHKQQTGDGSVSRSATLAGLKLHAAALEGLFQYEFIIESNREAAEFETHLQLLLDERVLELDDTTGSIKVNDNDCSRVILAALAPFLCLYYQLIVTLRQFPAQSEFNNKELVVRVQEHVEQLLKQPASAYVHPYCLALDNLNIAIHALVQHGYLLKERDSGIMRHAPTPTKCLRELEMQLLSYCQLMPFAQYSAAANQQAQWHIAKL
ncbi:dihydroxyacetone phosphate acyltransferase [Scaptodrosophila lebanonensis]|uniref:Dihydroxyacetone phosphate acyltransferase n=1 Tax=Drosophila lebanonensis TaxID=7225 RepID=A0A6J2TA02_DROLE|nr:dihydroxyacetone phosphate acyltransferase [Scaptodrosophila lebanonensis]